MKLSRKWIGTAGGGALAAIAVGALAADPLYAMSIKPLVSLAREATPAPPDYALDAAWAVRPASPPPGAWETPWGVDVFFIHPTSAYGRSWNVAIDHPRSVERLTETLLPVHAQPFGAAGPIYAPRYRQAGLYAERAESSDAAGARALAYSDVERAFDHYMASHNQGRGVMVVGVGQGASHAAELLRRRFADDAMRRRLAAAYLIDGETPANAGLPVPFCETASDIQCVAAWTTSVGGSQARGNGRDDLLACINPVTWRGDGRVSSVKAHRGGASPRAGARPDPVAHAVTAQCLEGELFVSRPEHPELQEPSRWGRRHQPARINLFYADVAFNAGERSRAASAWLDQNERKPAKPLPPVRELADAPIYREDGVADWVRR
jgi:hypothetical protein